MFRLALREMNNAQPGWNLLPFVYQMIFVVHLVQSHTVFTTSL